MSTIESVDGPPSFSQSTAFVWVLLELDFVGQYTARILGEKHGKRINRQ